jgi:hypothetical protein
MMFRQTALLALAGSLAALAPLPAAAQEEGGEKVNMVIVYGEEACPATKGDEIVVCARKPEAERFRIPAPFRGGDPNSTVNTAWSERARSFETVGQTGINSCSPVGINGASGCMAKLIHDAYAERKQPSDVHFGKAIEAERAKRAATIDASTAAEQARVEQIEKQYDERKAAEEAAKAGKVPATTPSDLATPPPGN